MSRSLLVLLLCLTSLSLAARKKRPKIIKHQGPKLSRYEQPGGVPSHPMHYLDHGVDVAYPIGTRDYHKEGAQKQAEIELELLESKLHRAERSAEENVLVRKKRFLDKTVVWEDGIIPFEISGLSASSEAFVKSAMGTVEQYTCVRFFVRDSGGYSVPHNVYLRFISGSGCNSYIGRTNRVPQDISPCDDYPMALHEIIHAMGGYHEQSHYDRDQNIHLKLNNVSPGRESNFQSVSEIFRNDFIIYPYNGQSTMHYSDFAFSKNGLPTLDPYYDDIATFREDFWYSMKEVNEAYQCTQLCTSGIPTCLNDGYPGYYEGSCQCICPEGLNPATNCATFLPGFTGELIDLTTSSRTASFGTPSAPSATIPAGSKYMWIVKAPAGSKLFISITDMMVTGSTTSCTSLLTVKRNLLGQNGTDYCGQGFSKPIMSVDNVIALILEAGTSSSSYLLATATLLPADEWCYNLADKGATYNGERNVAVDNTPCMNWAEAAKCDVIPFTFRPLQADYSGNQCRNPGSRLPQPWCYTDDNSGGCVVKLCNACNYGGEYDSYNDCSALIAANSNYCTTDDAAIGCRDTCNLDQTISSASSCGAPPDVDGGSLVRAPSASNSIGSSVNYECDIDNSIVIPRFCLSTGQWSEMGAVCNGGTITPTTTTTTAAPTTTTTGPTVVCDAGYTGNTDDGYCYRYLGTTTRFGHTAACAAEMAEVADPRTAETQAFLVALRDASGLQRGEDFSTSWDIGTSAGPNGFRNRCGYIGSQSTGNKWFASRCGETWDLFCKKNSLASSTAGEKPLLRHRRSTTICGDRRGDCQAVIDVIPDMCSTFSVYAQDCPASCGRCNPNIVNCNVPTPQAGENTVLQTAATYRIPGQVIQYACTSGVLASGNLQRACKRDGTLTGARPTCADVSATTSFVTKGELRPLQFVMPRMQMYGPSPLTTIKRSGKVVTWRAYCREPGTIRLMIMRNTGSTVTILGTNDVDCRQNRVMEWDIPSAQRISVQSGDFIGAADLAGGRLMYSFCEDYNNYGYLEYNFVSNSLLVPGAQLATDTSNYRCLVIPVSAVIGP